PRARRLLLPGHAAAIISGDTRAAHNSGSRDCAAVRPRTRGDARTTGHARPRTTGHARAHGDRQAAPRDGDPGPARRTTPAGALRTARRGSPPRAGAAHR
ncbi:MAG: hypothetical protein ACXVFO_20170, partial [Solirubrobacteraceae bacterium]